MCYALTETAHIGLDFEKALDASFPRDVILVSRDDGDITPAPRSGKRPAADLLENRVTKVAKLSHDGKDSSAVLQHQQNANPESVEDQLAKVKSDLGRARQQLAHAKTETQKREREYSNLEQRHDDNLYRLKEFEVECGELQARDTGERARARAIAQSMVQDERQRTKEACSKKLDSWKDRYEQQVKTLKAKQELAIAELKARHDDALKNKAFNHNVEVKKIKEKAEGDKKNFQDINVQHIKEIKSLKAQHKDFQRTLKAEQIERINAWKPEHSQTIKEKNTALNDKVKEAKALEMSLQSLNKENEALRAKLDGFNVTLENYKATMEQNQTDLSDLRYRVITLNDDQKRLLSDKADLECRLKIENHEMEEAHKAELEHCAARWQIQHDKAENMAQGVMHHQRTMFMLRNSVDSKNERIEKMQADIQKLRVHADDIKQAAKRSRHGRSRVDSLWDY